MLSASPSSSVKSQNPHSCVVCSSFLCKWQEHDVCVLHYTSSCIRGGSCAICKDWSEETWLCSDTQRDKRLAKMANRSVGKKAKGSVKGTPSHNSITSPVKTVVTPGSVKGISAGKEAVPVKGLPGYII